MKSFNMLSIEERSLIKSTYFSSNHNYKSIMRIFEVSQVTVRRILFTT